MMIRRVFPSAFLSCVDQSTLSAWAVKVQAAATAGASHRNEKGFTLFIRKG